MSKSFNLSALVRSNILSLAPYSSARSEFSGSASVWLDANESPYNGPYNRYPDPLQKQVKERLGAIKGWMRVAYFWAMAPTNVST